MLRHEFQPGRMIAGLALIAAGLVSGGDAGGLWDVPWFVVIPVVAGGLCLAAAAAVVAQSVRGRRGHRSPAGQDGRTVQDGEKPDIPAV
ncbi:hypothetical protein [Streptomyces sp. NPDC059009]|uniref:hypothetical protein n=1 Tax=Streptomyces sp. NPDC059009 TaxID=3346694 RepID=UPI00367F95D3